MQTLFCCALLTLLAAGASEVTPKDVTEFINSEMVCRQQVLDGSDLPFFVAAGGLLALSVVFLVVSIVLFMCLVKKASKQVKVAQEKANLVMDALLVALIPVEILKRLGSLPDLAEKKKPSKKSVESNMEDQ